MGHSFSCFQPKCSSSSPVWLLLLLPLPCSLRGCPALTTGSLCWSKIGFPTHVSQRPTTPVFSPSNTMEWSTTVAPTPTPRPRGVRPWWTPTTQWRPTTGGTAPPPSFQTALKTPLTFPPAQQSQEPPASSPSATWASPTPPALPLTSFPLPGAPLAHMRMEPIFLELSLSALQLALVQRLQPQQPPPRPQRQCLPQPPQPQPQLPLPPPQLQQT